jgi:hypothetical protein
LKPDECALMELEDGVNFKVLFATCLLVVYFLAYSLTLKMETYFPPKHLWTLTKLHRITTQMIVFFIEDDAVIFCYELKRLNKYSTQAKRIAAAMLKYGVNK